MTLDNAEIIKNLEIDIKNFYNNNNAEYNTKILYEGIPKILKKYYNDYDIFYNDAKRKVDIYVNPPKNFNYIHINMTFESSSINFSDII